MITRIGDAHGELEGHMILADKYPLIRSVNFLQNFGAISLTRCTIGVFLQHLYCRLRLVLQVGGLSFTHQEVLYLSNHLTYFFLFLGQWDTRVDHLYIINFTSPSLTSTSGKPVICWLKSFANKTSLS